MEKNLYVSAGLNTCLALEVARALLSKLGLGAWISEWDIMRQDLDRESDQERSCRYEIRGRTSQRQVFHVDVWMGGSGNRKVTLFRPVFQTATFIHEGEKVKIFLS